MSTQVSAEEVRAEVHRFWSILSGKSGEKLESLYSPTALVFTGRARRSESGRFAAMRRTRQLSGPDASAKSELDGIEVQVAAPDVAIATYTYRFSSTRAGKTGGREQRTTLSGRSTQIFQRDGKGAWKIVHEHLSSAVPPKVETVAQAGLDGGASQE
jgi:ketosteroid isomerase-like protein